MEPGTAEETQLDRAEQLSDALQRLDTFLVTNHFAVLKISQAHDAYASAPLRLHFPKLLKVDGLPVAPAVFSSDLHMLSAVFARLRDDSPCKAPAVSPNPEYRKYWVHPKQIMRVILTCLRYTQVTTARLTAGSPGSSSASGMGAPSVCPVESVYYDNQELESYHSIVAPHVQRSIRITLPEPFLVRVRWYDRNRSALYVSRSCPEAEGAAATGKRLFTGFAVPHKAFPLFLAGGCTTPQFQQEAAGLGARPPSLAAMEAVHSAIAANDLWPLLKTTFMRMSFALPGDRRVALNFDCNVAFQTQWNVAPGHWCSDVPAKESHVHFPYACLEVKTERVAVPPIWLHRLLRSEVCGCACMAEQQERGVLCPCMTNSDDPCTTACMQLRHVPLVFACTGQVGRVLALHIRQLWMPSGR